MQFLQVIAQTFEWTVLFSARHFHAQEKENWARKHARCYCSDFHVQPKQSSGIKMLGSSSFATCIAHSLVSTAIILRQTRSKYKKAVLSQRWPRDAPCMSASRISSQSRTRVKLNRVRFLGSPKFSHVSLELGGWRLGYEERRHWVLLSMQLVSKISNLCGPESWSTNVTDRRTDDMRSRYRALH